MILNEIRTKISMKTKPTNQFLALPIIATALFTGSSAIAATVFSANFDATTVQNYHSGVGNNWGAAITTTNLDAGTAIGNWTVNGRSPRRFLIMSTQRRKLAPLRSILLT
jgi:hypothetical protein